jgi:group I intron endonuclease
MDRYYVYVLMDSSKKGKYEYGEYEFDYEPFYIGKGTGNRVNETIHDKNIFKRNKINKLKRNNIDIKTKIIINNISDEQAKKYERELIKLIGRRDLKKGVLVNMTDGGDGRVNSTPSEETRKKISKTKKAMNITFKHSYETIQKFKEIQSGENNGFYGMTHSEESRNNISLKNSGHNHWMFKKTHTEETKLKLKKARNNYSNEKLKEVCQKFNKIVIKYDLNMNILAEYKSVKEASEKNNISESVISKCCRGEIYNPTRYFFKYKNINDRFKNNKFLINENFILEGKKYKMIKRNRTSCICSDGISDITIRYKDHTILKEKATNDSNFAELYIFMSNYGKFKKDISKQIIYNDDIKIHYNKLYENSELFIDNKEIFNRFSSNTINIFEDDWEENSDIIKSMLLNKIGDSPIKINSKNCEITIVNHNDKKSFLKDNHIKGNYKSEINYGLFYKNQLVSLITVDNNINLKNEECWLINFCDKKYHKILGSSNKLFEYFLKKHYTKNIIYYSDRSWGKDQLVENLGFKIIDKKPEPSFHYIINYKRQCEFHKNNNSFKIYDCGEDLYVFKPKFKTNIKI